MSQNLTIPNGGIVKKGRYGHISTTGNVILEEGVQFQTLNINGNARAKDLTGSSLTLNGDLKIQDGDLNVAFLRGRGSIVGSCCIRSNNIEFQGLINTQAGIFIRKHLNFSGLLTGQPLLVARKVDIKGVVEVEKMIAHEVCIKNLHPKIVPLKHIKWMVRPSMIHTISCYKAELHKCGCRFIQSSTLELLEGSFIYDAICIGSITTDKSSASVLTLGGGKRRHVAGY